MEAAAHFRSTSSWRTIVLTGLMASLWAGPALAQAVGDNVPAAAGQTPDAGQAGQEIVVTGFRQSVASALNAKRHA